MKKRILLIALALILTLSVFGCAKTDTAAPEATEEVATQVIATESDRNARNYGGTQPGRRAGHYDPV